MENCIAHYQVLRKLGQGGMGEVYLAQDLTLDREVALKFPKQDALQDDGVRKRFIDEAKAAAALDHPFICKVYETGDAGGQPYIAMEYVTGTTLKDRLAEGRMPPGEAVRVASEVMEALGFAHEHGLLHRDLKPANIMLSSAGHAKVMDFGLAKRLPPVATEDTCTLTAQTETGAVLGTLGYMSPEQLRAGRLDARSDIFAMGIVLFEMLTGIHPFLRDSALETAAAILNDPLPPLGAELEETAGLWLPILNKMLAKDTDERYSTARETLADLAEVQQAVVQPAPVLPSAGRRPAGKSRLRARAVGAAITVPGMGLVLFLLYQTFWAAPKTALAFQARDWILVTEFENQTGDPIFDRSLRTALIVGVQQSSYVNVFPDSRIQQTLQLMRKENVLNVDENIGSEVALREGIKGLLVCGISRIGEVYSLTARLVDPLTRTTAESHAVRAKGKDEVLSALDTLARRVRERLGESLARMPGQVVQVPRATTSSLEALKAYVDSIAVSRTDDRKSFQLLQHAVELDPDFALAHVQLGQAYYIGGNSAVGEKHFQKALSLLDRLTLRERLWVQAVVEDWRGNREQAVDRYTGYLAQYPDDLGAWFRMGWAQMATLHQYQPALESFNKVLALDPRNAAAYINVATCYGGLKRYPEAIVTYEKAFELRPDYVHDTVINHEYGFQLVMAGQPAKARDVFESMLKLGTHEKAKGHRSLALLEMVYGRYGSAAGHLREAILLNRTAAFKESELRDRLYLAGAFRTMGQIGEVSAELAQVERLLAGTHFAPAWLTRAAQAFSEAGNTRMVSRLNDELARRLHDVTAVGYLNRSVQDDQASFSQMKGILALAKGTPAQALDDLESALRIRTDNGILSTLASAYTALGNTDEAVRRYRELLGRFELGNEEQEYWFLAHYRLGKLYEQRKEMEKAKECYQKLLDLWKQADTHLQPLADAKARLARL